MRIFSTSSYTRDDVVAEGREEEDGPCRPESFQRRERILEDRRIQQVESRQRPDIQPCQTPRIMVPFEQNHPPVPLTHANRASGT